MSSSGVCSASYKQELEKRNNEPFDDSSTRVFVFREVSSLDEDDSCNLGRRSSWSSTIGLVKKIKLSEDGTALISESFENFCEIHKNVRKNDDRPHSSEGQRVPKPPIQPKVERGLKIQQRPTTAGKLAEIAVKKYPDSIFKVYIPEGNRIIRKKRVVPILDLKPVTPMRTRPNSRDVPDKNPDQRTAVPPLKAKHSIPHQALQNSDRRPHKPAGDNPASRVSKPIVSGQTPKKMTHITDISLTKEQEKKRMIEREVMRKRTMDVVKMAFPISGSDEIKHNEQGVRLHDSEICGEENSRQKKRPSKSKSSLKSYSSVTSCGLPLTAKRSVTWGENEWSDSPSQLHGDNKPFPRRKKRMVHLHRNMSTSSIGRADSNSGTKIIFGSRSYGKSLKGMMTNSNKREKKKYSRTRSHNETSKPNTKTERKTLRKKDVLARRTIEDTSDSDLKDESDSEVRCSRDRFQKKKHVKDKKPLRRCDCGRVIERLKDESKNNIDSLSSELNLESKNESIDVECLNDNYIVIDKEDSFQNRRSAIIRKHSTKEAFTHSKKIDFAKTTNTEKESDPDLKASSFYNEEEISPVKRGRSTPSLRKISTIDCSYGSSDSELCFRKDSSYKQYSDKGGTKISSDEISDEKPLRKIFDSSNSQNEVAKNELGIIMPIAEKKDSSKSFIGINSIGSARELQENIAAETFSEGFTTSRLNVKSLNAEDLCSMDDIKYKYLSEEESTIENLMKEDRVLNLRPMIGLSKEESKGAQNLSTKTSRCNSLLLPGQLSNEFVVDAYNVVTNSSKSLSRERSSSVPLIREIPMLNLPYDEKSLKLDAQGTAKKSQLPRLAPKSATEVLKESNISAQFHLIPEITDNQDSNTDQSYSQHEYLQNDYSQSFKVKSKSEESGKTKKPALRMQRLSSNEAQDSKIFSSIGTSRSRINFPENLKPGQRQQTKQNLPRNPPEKSGGVAEKNPSPLSPKLAEERKLHLQKMLSRGGESVGTSKMASQIMEKWNSTQKSISQRKEKMLASIRDTRHADTDRTTNLESKGIMKRILPSDKKKPQVNYQVIQEIELRLSVEEIKGESNNSILPSNEAQQIEYDSVNEEDCTSLSEKEDFETTIVKPGSRVPQPYSSTNILDPSDRHLDESLSPYTVEDTPEKPLCESHDSGFISLQVQNNKILDKENKQSNALNPIPNVDEEIPERDVSGPPTTDLVRTDKTSLEAYIKARSSISDVDSTYGSTRSNMSNNESSNCSHIMSNEAIHSDENVNTQMVISSMPPSRNVQEEFIPLKRNALPKSASYSRATSHERSVSRRSKASSSGSSRRSVEPIGRPPSRKPHMISSSEEDSDQDIITTSSPFHIECYNQNVKKAPTSRMYSTLNHTPHPGQDSIKTAIKDLDSVKEDVRSSLYSDRPMSSGQSSSRGGGNNQSGSSRPSSGKSNIPKMSPGSIKILKEKSKNSPQRNVSPDSIDVKENVPNNRNTKQSTWVQNTRQQDSPTFPCSSKSDKGSSGGTQRGSLERGRRNEKPRFRYFSRNKYEEEDIWNLQKFRSMAVSKKIENYLPPWERVDLTPPESALRERASNERRLGITSRVTARTSSPQSNVKAAIQKGKTSNSCRKTPVGGSTPSGPKTPGSPESPFGGRSPFRDRTPLNNNKTPIGGQTPITNRTPVNSRSPIGSLSPVVGSRTPIRNRTPNPPERRTIEQKITAEKNSSLRTDEKLQQQSKEKTWKYS